MFDRIEGDRPQAQCILYCLGDLRHRKGLQQPQHLHVLPLAAFRQSRFQQPAQLGELLRQLPAHQWRGLIQRIRLLLQQRQVVQRVEDHIFPLVAPPVPSNHLRSARDHYLVNVAFGQNFSVAPAHRHGIIVAAIPHQRQRTHSPGSFVARFVWRHGQRQQRLTVLLEPLPDGLLVPAQPLLAPLLTLFQQACVQLFPVRASRHRNHKVPRRISNQPLHFPFIVPLARPPEPLLEQVVALQLRKRLRLLSRPVSQNPRHRQLGVVVQHRPRYSAELFERVPMPFQKRLRRFGREGHHEAVVRLRQIDRQIVRLPLLPADHHLRFPEVRLRVSRRMHQRHEHLPLAQPLQTHVVLHDGVATAKSVLVSQSLVDSFCRVALLPEPLAIFLQDGIDHSHPRIQLRPLRRLLPPVARRRWILHHLPNRLTRQPVLPRYLPLALPLDLNISPYSSIQFHFVHPSGIPRNHTLRLVSRNWFSGGLFLLRQGLPLSRRFLV